MTITDLEEYLNLKNEIKQLGERIEKHKIRENEIVGDTVKDYRYGEHIIVIRGCSVKHGDKIRRLAKNCDKKPEPLF